MVGAYLTDGVGRVDAAEALAVEVQQRRAERVGRSWTGCLLHGQQWVGAEVGIVVDVQLGAKVEPRVDLTHQLILQVGHGQITQGNRQARRYLVTGQKVIVWLLL